MVTEIMEERSLKRFSLLYHSVSVLHMPGVKKKESGKGNVMLDLHLDAFQKRLPFFHSYDHTNYTRGADDMWCCVICANEKASSRGKNRV